MDRKIIHIDMDAFYASVEQLDNSDLKGKAVIVGWDSPRGVVCAASYQARKFGIRSAMAMVRAREDCPHGIFIPPRMKRYSEVSSLIHAVFNRYTDLVEPLSLDEAYLDVTDNKPGLIYASTIAREIKESIKKEIGLTASAGVASNKFIAKIASDVDKPDGLTVVPPHKEESFLKDMPVSRIQGVGAVTRKRLHQMGARSIGQLADVSKAILEAEFGKMGTTLHALAKGMDDRLVNPEREHKSIGHETTFEEDQRDEGMLMDRLRKLAGEVEGRLKEHDLKGRTITLKVKYYDFELITRSRTLAHYTDDKECIIAEIALLARKTEIGRKPVRLVGVSLSNLSENPLYEQLSLFISAQEGYTYSEKQD